MANNAERVRREVKSIRREVKIDGVPVGWAWVHQQGYIKGTNEPTIYSLLLHNDHLPNDGFVEFGWTETDFSKRDEPTELGFYVAKDHPQNWVFHLEVVDYWTVCYANGAKKYCSWSDIEALLGDSEIMRIGE